jgi:protein-disulfide isomerase
MDNNQPNKYELHRQKKDQEQVEVRRARVWKKTRRISLWLVAGAVLVGIIAGMNYLIFSGQTGQKGPATAQASEILKPKTDDWMIGSTTTAKVVLVEYSDFECPACGAYHPIVSKLLTEFGGQVAYVYRHYPWYFHPQARASALVAEAAGRQGKFWEMSEQLFSNQEAWSKEGANPQALFASYALKIGLDPVRFQADLKDPSTARRIDRDLAEAKTLNITYTPSFFVNGQLVENPNSYDKFKALLQQTISR